MSDTEPVPTGDELIPNYEAEGIPVDDTPEPLASPHEDDDNG